MHTHTCACAYTHTHLSSSVLNKSTETHGDCCAGRQKPLWVQTVKSSCLGGQEGNSLAQKQPKTQAEWLTREGGQDLYEGAHSDRGARGSSPHSPHDLQWPSKHPAAKENSPWQEAKSWKAIPLRHRPKGRPSAEGGDCSGHSVHTISTGRRCSESSSAEVTTATNPKPSPAPTSPSQQNKTYKHFTCSLLQRLACRPKSAQVSTQAVS